MAQTLQIKKVNARPSTFEKGTIYFNPSQKEILLGLGSGSTEGTHYVVFKGTDTDNNDNTNVNGGTTTAKRYLLGTSSTTNTSSTNTNASCYMQSGALYSDGARVLTSASAVAGSNINSVGTPSVTVSTSNGVSTFTFNYLKGSTGATGDPGDDGTDGAAWYSGTTAPSTSTGVIGDWYINTNTYDIYKKTASTTWTKQCNIKGATGSNGTNGTNGTNGSDGLSMFYCSNASYATSTTYISRSYLTPSSSTKTPIVGDMVLTSSGLLFAVTAVATSTLTVSYLTSLKGAQGDPGSSASDTNYYPTGFSWSNGTTAGPTGSLTGTGMSAVSFGAIPSASSTTSGIITTGDQSFAGSKRFEGGIKIGAESSSSGSSYSRSIVFGDMEDDTVDNEYCVIAETDDDMLLLKATNGIQLNSDESVTANCPIIANYFSESDERLKSFKEDIKLDFEALKKLPKKYFEWIEKPGKLEFGTSAQEVQKLYPELVLEDKNGYLSVDYGKLSIVALKAVDELYDKNKELEERIERLEKLLIKE